MIVFPVGEKGMYVDLKSTEMFSDVVISRPLFSLFEIDQDYFDIV